MDNEQDLLIFEGLDVKDLGEGKVGGYLVGFSEEDQPDLSPMRDFFRPDTDYDVKDGDKVRVITRRGSLEARAQVGTNSLVKPARNNVPRGYMFGPWNLSVADSADPKKNKWLANGVTSRVWDPVSGQVDFKKSACRIEKI